MRFHKVLLLLSFSYIAACLLYIYNPYNEYSVAVVSPNKIKPGDEVTVNISLRENIPFTVESLPVVIGKEEISDWHLNGYREIRSDGEKFKYKVKGVFSGRVKDQIGTIDPSTQFVFTMPSDQRMIGRNLELVIRARDKKMKATFISNKLYWLAEKKKIDKPMTILEFIGFLICVLALGYILLGRQLYVKV